MLKNIFGVISGFVLWSALWIASDFVLLLLSPVWYGENSKNFSTSVLFISLTRSVMISFTSGLAAAFIARRNCAATGLVLGILLLAFGIFVEAQLWNSIPLWYHVIFLALLIPATFFGASLRKA
jgi:hypothetical protein